MRTTIETNGNSNGILQMMGLTVEEVQIIRQLRLLRKRGWDRFLIERKEEYILVWTVGRPEVVKGE